jgi:hypothetical protein
LERPLCGDCGGNGVSGAVERDEKPVPRGVDLVSTMFRQGRANRAVMCRPDAAELGS